MNGLICPLVAAAPKPRENGFVSLSSKPAPAPAAKPGDESKPAANSFRLHVRLRRLRETDRHPATQRRCGHGHPRPMQLRPGR